jgi:hypothetical protein
MTSSEPIPSAVLERNGSFMYASRSSPKCDRPREQTTLIWTAPMTRVGRTTGFFGV